MFVSPNWCLKFQKIKNPYSLWKVIAHSILVQLATNMHGTTDGQPDLFDLRKDFFCAVFHALSLQTVSDAEG